MGLIDRYGKDLLGKIFIWQAIFNHSSPGDVWFIAKVTECRSLGSNSIIFYETLLRNHVGTCGHFSLDGEVDRNSILIGNSLEFETYLGLFDGTNQ